MLPAQTREEHLFELVAYYDQFAEHYGWGPDEVDRQPYWFTSRAPLVWRLRREMREERPR